MCPKWALFTRCCMWDKPFGDSSLLKSALGCSVGTLQGFVLSSLLFLSPTNFTNLVKKTIIRIQPKTLLSKHFGKLNSLWSWLLSQITSTFFSVNLSFPSFSFVFCHSLLHWRSLQFFNYMRKKEPMPHALPMYRSKRRWSCLYWTSNWIKVTLWNTVAISSPGVTAGGLASAKNIVWFKSIPPVISG